MSAAAAALALHAAAMFALGTLAATVGALAGLGGGFIVVPVLRIFFHSSPEAAASASLVLVLANVASASVAFWRQGRVDVRLAATMGLAAIPGSIAGALALRAAPAAGFDLPYAALLAYFSVTLLRHDAGRSARSRKQLPWARARTFTDPVTRNVYRYHESPPLAAAAGIATGFLSSFFGIGGGVFIVPLLLRGFALPGFLVAATSSAIILCSVPFGVATHALRGNIVWSDAWPLVAGGLAGGQFGASLARRLTGPALVRFVGGILALVALSLIVQQIAGYALGRR